MSTKRADVLSIITSLGLPAPDAPLSVDRTAVYSCITESWIEFSSPLGAEHRYRPEADVGNIRLLGLAVIANNFAPDDRDETPHLLFKLHPDWDYVLPSVSQQLGLSFDDVAVSVSSWVRERFGCRTIRPGTPLGCVVSFKHSPTNGESSPYVFPLVAIRTSVPSNKPQLEFTRNGRDWAYLNKKRLESDVGLHNGPNADVYRSLERIDSSWMRIERLGYEFDLAISYAGEQRDEVAKLTQVLSDLRPDLAIFHDEDMNMAGANLDIELAYAYREGCRRAVICVSAGYRGRQWTEVEYQSLLVAARRRRGDTFLVPVSMDGTRDLREFDGMYFVPYDEFGVEKTAQAIAELF